ncbi:phage major capsid protein, partial [Staphylococcus aureus]|nr:phage major capsid protein [Staphylococcus aureus]
GTLTFAPGQTVVNEIKDVKKVLSKNANDVNRKIDGKVVLVLNPSDKADVDATSTVLTANGTYVTVIPGGLDIV